ncbi:MAG: hypothetical protein RIQ52_465, partial [Pseudomonadota bacterium]
YFDQVERDVISTFFVEKWGYNPEFVATGIDYIQQHIADFSIRELAKALAEYKKNNPDCEHKAMSREIIDFLREVIEADGKIDELEAMSLDSIENAFNEANKFDIKKALKSNISTAGVAVTNIALGAGSIGSSVKSKIKKWYGN